MSRNHPHITEETLELYVLGALSPEEALAVEAAAAIDDELAEQLDDFRYVLEQSARSASVAPKPRTRDLLFATIDGLAELSQGGIPLINSRSRAEDYERWTAPHLPAMRASDEDFICVPLGSDDRASTFLAKMCSSIPTESHTDEIERILVLEGDCAFKIGDDIQPLCAGTAFTIPLHLPHSGWVTTAAPCYFIVQRSQV